ncbi:MAG: flavin reductase family protein, partial [Clostridia bacterium]
SDNPWKLIGNDWMLVTSGDINDFNTMTASWGCVGVLWNKNICQVFVRPSRYTYEFIERTRELTLSFLPPERHDVLAFCGAHSGRDVDKCQSCGLTPFQLGNCVAFNEARLVLSCRVLYAQDIEMSHFVDDAVAKGYAGGDYHRMFTCEITQVLKK